METVKQLLAPLLSWAENINIATPTAAELAAWAAPWVIALTRLLLPLLAAVVLARCGRSLLRGKNEAESWGWLQVSEGLRLPINHWENVIGRGRSSDILINLPSISRTHAALIRDKAGLWTLTDLNHKQNVTVNGEIISVASVFPGDRIGLADCELQLQELTPEEEQQQRASRTVPGREISPSRTLSLLTCFAVLMAVQLCLVRNDMALVIGGCFALTLALMWGSWLFSCTLRRTGFEIETLGFFLTLLGLAVVSSSDPSELPKHCAALLVGMAGFLILGWILRDIRRVKALRWPAAGAGVALLAYVLLRGEVIYGARNWINIAGFSFQPSELVKVAFIFAGAATLDRLFARRNLYSFIFLSLVMVGMLAKMSDFGTAAIFFAVYVIIAYLRSGDLATVALSISGAGLAGIIALAAKPYIAERFSTWAHAWDFVNSGGYQQTRAMSALASGGLFGLGGGEGWLRYVSAADTDLVFAMVAEEWGLLLAFSALAALIVLALFAVRAAFNARSAYYVIAACATAGLLLTQTMLNVGGSLDLLPLTGVTFPFVSNGGSSLISCWCLLAFLKAADTRQNASFAIGLPRRRRKVAPPPVTVITDEDVSPFDAPDWLQQPAAPNEEAQHE